MPVFRLDDNARSFPPPEFARDDGLLAAGGNLLPETLINAYKNGIFPWYEPGGEIMWWAPPARFLIFPGEINVSRSMRKFIKKAPLEVTFNTDFAGVMHSCRVQRENETWITDEMEEAYNRLFAMGYASSVEVRDAAGLAGGLYGVVIGRCFFGESMFSLTKNASKLALIRLCEKLYENGFLFIDCQFHTPHLESMGGRYAEWLEYKRLLTEGTAGV